MAQNETDPAGGGAGDFKSLARLTSPRSTNDPPKLQAVYVGGECAGFILARGIAGFEAFRDNRSLGLFTKSPAAADAILGEVRQ